MGVPPAGLSRVANFDKPLRRLGFYSEQPHATTFISYFCNKTADLSGKLMAPLGGPGAAYSGVCFCGADMDGLFGVLDAFPQLHA